jgi:uncharacterized protein YbbK (DUF523 family)
MRLSCLPVKFTESQIGLPVPRAAAVLIVGQKDMISRWKEQEQRKILKHLVDLFPFFLVSLSLSTELSWQT